MPPLEHLNWEAESLRAIDVWTEENNQDLLTLSICNLVLLKI